MRALSLLQPWATLMALDEKRYETRSKPTKVRGDVAIVSSLGFDASLRAMCEMHPFSDVLKKHNLNAEEGLPLGMVLAVVEFVDSLPTEKIWLHESSKFREWFPPAPNEFSFGDYSPGRWVWMTRRVRKLKNPVPIMRVNGDGKVTKGGAQGFYTLSPACEAAVLAEMLPESTRVDSFVTGSEVLARSGGILERAGERAEGPPYAEHTPVETEDRWHSFRVETQQPPVKGLSRDTRYELTVSDGKGNRLTLGDLAATGATLKGVSGETRMAVREVGSQSWVQRVDLGAAPMVTLDALDVGEVEGVDGAFVKWAPTVPSNRKAEVDPAAVRKMLQERGAVGVLVAPLMERAEVRAPAPAPLPSASPREALEEWLREQDVPEEVRTAALHEADAIFAEEKL